MGMCLYGDEVILLFIYVNYANNIISNVNKQSVAYVEAYSLIIMTKFVT